MKILFASSKIERLCTDLKVARKFFGGDEALVRGLFSRINALHSADTIKDIIVQPPFSFISFIAGKMNQVGISL